MTMKKRFLGLALAAMVAVPATTAYAAESETITFDENQPKSYSIPVRGTVSKADGSAPAGKLTVELPTAMTFAVNADSTVIGGTYNVSNNSAVPIKLSVSEFRKANGNITVEDTDTFQPQSQNRSHVRLSLDGRVESGTTSVDLGSFISDGILADVEILEVEAKNSGTITLSGEAGTQKDSGSVDTDGTSGEFNLVFKIAKKS